MLVVPVSVAEKVGTMPATGFEFLFLNVIEMGAAVDPSATTGPTPVMDEFVATTV